MTKQRYVGDQRRPYLVSVAVKALERGDKKTQTITIMKECNREHCDPPLLMRDMGAYYADAVKKFELAGNENIDAMEMQAIEETDPDKVATVLDLARRMYDLNRKIELQASFVDQLKAEYNALALKKLPDAMREAGVGDEFPLANGWSVKRTAQFVGNLPTASAISREKDPEAKTAMRKRLEDALQFLVDTGNQGIIKDKFEIQLGKGETNRAKGIENFLRKRGIPFLHDKSVHPQTLGSWVREQIKEGRELPFDLFGVHEVVKVTLVAPKRK